jgi:hypothetical protein
MSGRQMKENYIFLKFKNPCHISLKNFLGSFVWISSTSYIYIYILNQLPNQVQIGTRLPKTKNQELGYPNS